MPLKRRVPKRGFTNIFRIEYRTVLQKIGLLRKGKNPVKVLGNGELTIALTVRAHKYTGSAVQKIEAAGGKAEVIS